MKIIYIYKNEYTYVYNYIYGANIYQFSSLLWHEDLNDDYYCKIVPI